jgi:hypothetical protein
VVLLRAWYLELQAGRRLPSPRHRGCLALCTPGQPANPCMNLAHVWYDACMLQQASHRTGPAGQQDNPKCPQGTWMTMERNVCTASRVDGLKRVPSWVLNTMRLTLQSMGDSKSTNLQVGTRSLTYNHIIRTLHTCGQPDWHPNQNGKAQLHSSGRLAPLN